MAEEIRASPSDLKPTHHIKLIRTSGSPLAIGLNAVDSAGQFDVRAIRRDPANPRTTAPQRYGGRWDNRQPPYFRIVQDDFSGGQGKRDFEANRSSFRDSGWLWSASEGKVHPAPRFKLTTGYRLFHTRLAPEPMKYHQHVGVNRVIGAKFTAPAAGMTVRGIRVCINKFGATGTIDLLAHIYSDVAGSPGAQLGGGLIAYSGDAAGLMQGWRLAECVPPLALTGGTAYWVVLNAPGGVAEYHHESLGSSTATAGESKYYDGLNWQDLAGFQLFYILEDNSPRARRFLFEYKRVPHMVVVPLDGTTPKLYRNGFMGVATGAQSLTSLVDTTAAWPAAGLVGQRVILIEGQGRGQDRRINSNAATTLDLSTDPLDIAALDKGTAYAIVGGDVWYEVVPTAGSNFESADAVTDVLVANDTIYFGRGTSAAIRRHRYYPSGASGAWVWTQSVATEGAGANKADVLKLAFDSVDKMQVLRAQNGDANGNHSISRSNIPAWGNDLSFKTPEVIGDRHARINSLEWHGALTWIGREDGLWNIKSDVPDNILPDMVWARSPRNAVAMAVQTPMLLFNLGQGVERTVGQDVDDFGPDRDEGVPRIPFSRQGVATQIMPGVRYIYVAFDPGTILLTQPGLLGLASSLWLHNKVGWHELLRLHSDKQRILDSCNKGLLTQRLTDKPTRIWLATESWVGYIEMPEFGTDPARDTRIRWNHEGYLHTCRFTDNTLDIDKWWGSIKFFTKNLSPGVAWLEVDYRVDDAEAWSTIATKVETSPTQEVVIGNGLVTGKVLELRVRLYTMDSTVRPEVLSFAIDGIARYKTNWLYPLDFALVDMKGRTPDLEDAAGKEVAATINTFLTQACEDPIPMTMECVLEEFHNKKVLVEPSSLRPIEWAKGQDSRRMVGHVVLTEAA